MNASFLGTVVSMELDVAGQRIVAERHHPRREDIPAVGSSVAFSVPRSACMLFHPESGKALGREATP